MKIGILLGTLTAIAILPLTAQSAKESQPKINIKDISIIESSTDNAITIDKWKIEEEYQQPSELDEYEWSSIIWG